MAAAYVARLPGFYDFDDLVDQGLPDWVSTISVLRGIELDEYTNRRWLSRPHSASGASREIGGEEPALIYDTGGRSLVLATTAEWFSCGR